MPHPAARSGNDSFDNPGQAGWRVFAIRRILVAGAAGSVDLYHAKLEGFSVAGFQSIEYFSFVVSDLGQDEMLRVAAAVAPPLRAALDGSGGRARMEVPAAAPLRPGV